MVGSSWNIVHEERCPEIGPICEQREEPPQIHDQFLDFAQLRVDVEHGLTERLGWQLQLPLKLVRSRITYRRLDGTPFELDYENIHHRNETLFGVMDPWLLGRATADVAGFRLAARVGASLPLGAIEPDPYAAATEGQSHQHIQFGAGTVRPVVIGEVARSVGAFTVAGYGQLHASLYQNRYGFLSGQSWGAGLSGAGPLVGALRGSLAVDVLGETAEQWNGVIHSEGNVGRTDLLIGLGLAYQVRDVIISANAKRPVWQHLAGEGQLSYPLVVEVGVSTLFGATR